MVTIFFSYSHRDEDLRNELEIHLSALKRKGVIKSWHDRRLTAGDEFANKISGCLESADIILLPVRPLSATWGRDQVTLESKNPSPTGTRTNSSKTHSSTWQNSSKVR